MNLYKAPGRAHDHRVGHLLQPPVKWPELQASWTLRQNLGPYVVCPGSQGTHGRRRRNEEMLTGCWPDA